MPSSNFKHPAQGGGSVIDIGGSLVEDLTRTRLKVNFLSSKLQEDHPVLPDELLYDDDGLRLWSEIIYSPEYYQTHDETTLLKQNAHELVANVPDGATIIDLGAGDTRKVAHLLSALDKQQKGVTYFALDIAPEYLSQNITRLSMKFENIPCFGVWGTFSDAMKWSFTIPSPRVFLSLGSILFNDAWSNANAHLHAWSSILRSDDLILAGMDGHQLPKDAEKIWTSYHFDESAFAKFWTNGFEHANRLVGENWFNVEDWEVTSKLETEPVSHRYIFKAKRDLTLGSTSVRFKKGDLMDWFDAHKYGVKDVKIMCKTNGLEIVKMWKAPNSEMYQYLLRLQAADSLVAA